MSECESSFYKLNQLKDKIKWTAVVVGRSNASATQKEPSGETFTGPSLTPLCVCERQDVCLCA